jgi:ribosomal protein S18 acetylase RimI-like enzyme
MERYDRVLQVQQHLTETLEVTYRACTDLGMQIDHVADATVFRWSTHPHPVFNQCFGLGDERVVTDDVIERVIDFFREQESSGRILVSPRASDRLGQRLEARGCTRCPSQGVLLATPESWSSPSVLPGITIERTVTANRTEFVRVMMQAFEMTSSEEEYIRTAMDMPEAHCFLARCEGQAVGVGVLMVTGKTGGLYSGGVLEEFRNRGVQTALIARRVESAFQLGLQFIVSATDEVENQSSRNLRKHGFSLAYELKNYEVTAA